MSKKWSGEKIAVITGSVVATAVGGYLLKSYFLPCLMHTPQNQEQVDQCNKEATLGRVGEGLLFIVGPIGFLVGIIGMK